MHYEITADTCQLPKVVFTQKGLSFDEAKTMAVTLSGAFREVKVENQITGELELNIYTSSEFFTPTCSIAEAFKKAKI